MKPPSMFQTIHPVVSIGARGDGHQSDLLVIAAGHNPDARFVRKFPDGERHNVLPDGMGFGWFKLDPGVFACEPPKTFEGGSGLWAFLQGIMVAIDAHKKSNATRIALNSGFIA